MIIYRHHDGVNYLDRGDYVEVWGEKKNSCAKVYVGRKGRYFIHKNKRIYVKED